MAMDEEEVTQSVTNDNETVTLPVTDAEVLEAPSADEVDSNYYVESYLKGLVRNIVIDADSMTSILMRAGVEPCSLFSDLSERERKLCEAWMYVWLSTSPITSQKVKDADGQWSHEEGGEVMSATLLNRYLTMANQIFKELGMDTIGNNKWGFKGNGFRNIRGYGGRGRNLR